MKLIDVDVAVSPVVRRAQLLHRSADRQYRPDAGPSPGTRVRAATTPASLLNPSACRPPSSVSMPVRR